MLLFDVKTVHGGGDVYVSAWARTAQSGAVQERAWRVQHSYTHHAGRLDTADSPAGTTPTADRLGTFTRVRGLVFGQYGEASPDVHSLLTIAW